MDILCRIESCLDESCIEMNYIWGDNVKYIYKMLIIDDIQMKIKIEVINTLINQKENKKIYFSFYKNRDEILERKVEIGDLDNINSDKLKHDLMLMSDISSFSEREKNEYFKIRKVIDEDIKKKGS